MKKLIVIAILLGFSLTACASAEPAPVPEQPTPAPEITPAPTPEPEPLPVFTDKPTDEPTGESEPAPEPDDAPPVKTPAPSDEPVPAPEPTPTFDDPFFTGWSLEDEEDFVPSLPTCNGLYPRIGKVIDLDFSTDTVVLEDGAGLTWSFYGINDYFAGDLVALIMDDAGTPEYIYDDIIVCARYGGFFD